MAHREPLDPLEDDVFVAEPLEPERKETAELVAQAVGLLPPLQREALILPSTKK